VTLRESVLFEVGADLSIVEEILKARPELVSDLPN
jgi:hypothetical protein